jgi:tight adherence protein B
MSEVTAMTGESLLAALGGAAGVGGLLLAAAGLAGARRPPPRPAPVWAVRLAAAWAPPGMSGRDRAARRARWMAAAVLGAAVWVGAGWPAAGLIVAVVVAGLPALFGGDRAARRVIARLEALESWTRRLADLRIAGGGLEQALAASMRSCPEAIRGEAEALAARLRAGWPAQAALRALADDLGEPAGDLVVAVLLLEAERRGAGVARVLDDLADTVAEEVLMRRRVEADRAKPRTTARWVSAITLGTVAVGALNTAYTAPYRTPAGQLVLAGVAVAFGACLAWMRLLAQGRPEPRFLHTAGAEGPGGARRWPR